LKCDLKKKFADGKVTLGTWVTVGHPDVPDILEELGFDWLVFDTEHAPLGRETVSRMILAIDEQRVCPIVRVGAIDQYLVKSALDMGAHGVVCPLVNSAQEARMAASYVKYPPIGIRGVAPRKAADYGLSFPEYLRKANEMTVLVAQIETKQALDNLDEILSVKEVDVAFVGPTDLTVSLGLLDDRTNPKVIEAMKKVVRGCESHGKVPGVLAATPEEAKRAVSNGFRFIGLGSDTRFMTGGAKPFLEAAR
jgi:2-keto-3-deoxy-L-rhamnonate aldolase RhmA